MTASLTPLIIRELGLRPYSETWQAMQDFTNARTADTVDELWLLEHPPVFTQGQSGKAEHVLDIGEIPLIPADRGGQVTYHGPGQLIAYTLIDIRRKNLSIRQLVSGLENAVIAVLASYGIQAEAQCKAPGVYVGDKKICSIGLRVRRGFAFHGLALNVNMDVKPFLRINPCGYAGLEMTQLVDLGGPGDLKAVGQQLIKALSDIFEYDLG